MNTLGAFGDVYVAFPLEIKFSVVSVPLLFFPQNNNVFGQIGSHGCMDLWFYLITMLVVGIIPSLT